jgi:hypothetical protein
MLPITILLSSTREIVIETLISPIFDMPDEPFHYVLQFSIVYTYDGLTLTIYKLRYTNVHRLSQYRFPIISTLKCLKKR